MSRIFEILLVDDSSAERLLAGEAIAEFAPDMRLISLGSRAELFKHLATHPHPNFILLDLHIGPDLGSDITYQLHGKTTVPIAVLSTTKNAIERARCLAMGAVDYFEKPVNFGEYSDIIDRIRTILASYHS